MSNQTYNDIFKAIILYIKEPDEITPNITSYQIYIPELDKEHKDSYQQYILDNDKEINPLYEAFPWAKCNDKNYRVGEEVYCGYASNKNGDFVILNSSDIYSYNKAKSPGVIELAMSIIVSNKLDISYNDWPNYIINSKYTNIVCDEYEGWYIGLMQWCNCSAFDLLYYIVYNDNDLIGNLNTDIQLFKDIQNAVLTDSKSPYRNKYQRSFQITYGTDTYNEIQKILGSDKGKQLQREFAKQRVSLNLQMLQGENYNIQNPAILIFLLDILEQYGPNINNTIKGCLTKASKICQSNESIMTQFERYYNYWSDKTVEGMSRRAKTKSYIVELEKEGKLTYENLIHLNTYNDIDMSTDAEYCLPFVGRFGINAKFGRHTDTKIHSGIDFNCAPDTQIIACTNGIILTVDNWIDKYGNYIELLADDGNKIIYGDLHKAIVQPGQIVKKGQLLGYSDNTGNSTGNHLHFEIRVLDDKSNKYININPLTYLGHDQFGSARNMY